MNQISTADAFNLMTLHHQKSKADKLAHQQWLEVKAAAAGLRRDAECLEIAHHFFVHHGIKIDPKSIVIDFDVAAHFTLRHGERTIKVRGDTSEWSAYKAKCEFGFSITLEGGLESDWFDNIGQALAAGEEMRLGLMATGGELPSALPEHKQPTQVEGK